MTFEQFQATRQETNDVQAASGMDLGYDTVFPGYVYEGGLHIFTLGEGRFELVIGNSDKVSGDLTELERDLYEYDRSEGFFSTAEDPK
jgi:hypothetical protein